MDEKTRKYLEQGGALTNGQIPTQVAPTGLSIAPINSTLLEPVSQLPFKNPNPVPVPVISALSTDVSQMTAPEVQATDLTTRLQELNKQLTGQSTFRTQQEETVGLQGLQKTQQELANQLKAVQAEAQAIPLQLQQEATGRGITAGGLAPLQTARLRTNAIQALGISAALQASQGNLALAQDQINRAVAAKFDPIKERIAVETANLKLILESPEYSLADKKRASDMLRQKEIEDRKIATEEQNSKAIYNLSIEAAKQGADTVSLRNIQNSTTPEEALTYAAPFLKEEEKAAAVIGSAETGYVQWNPKTGRYDIAVTPPGGQKPTGVGGITGRLVSVLSGAKVGQTTKTAIGTIMGVINAAEEMAKASSGGVFTGISPLNTILNAKIPFTDIGIPFREALKSQKGTQNTAYINAINLKVQQWASGASLTKQQTEQVAKLVPTTSDTDEKVKEKLNNLVDIMNQQIKGSLQAEGIEYQPEKVDLFAENKSLADIFK